MPLTLHVSLSKKQGLANYSSVGAVCGLEVELEAHLLLDRETLQTRMREAFASCSVGLHQELSRQLGQPLASPDDESASLSGTSANRTAPDPEPGETDHETEFSSTVERSIASGSDPLDSSSSTQNGHAYRAITARQLSYVRQLADQVPELGPARLGILCLQLFDRDVSELTRVDARQLIDLLKAARRGSLTTEDLFAGAGVSL